MKVTRVLKDAAMLAVGGIGAQVVNSKLTMVKNDKIRAAIPILLGAFLASKKGTASIGAGMMTVGATKLATALIPGIGGLYGDDMDELNGIYDTEVVAGYQDTPLMGYQDNVLNGLGDDVVA